MEQKLMQYVIQNKLDEFVQTWMKAKIDDKNKYDLLKNSLIYRRFDIAKFLFMNGIGICKWEINYWETYPNDIINMMTEYEKNTIDDLNYQYISLDNLIEKYAKLNATYDSIQANRKIIEKLALAIPRETMYEGKPIEYLNIDQKEAIYKLIEFKKLDKDNQFENNKYYFNAFFRVKYDKYWLYHFYCVCSPYWLFNKFIVDKYYDRTSNYIVDKNQLEIKPVIIKVPFNTSITFSV